MSDELRGWLSNELKQQGWSYRELGRRADISNALVSRIMTGDMPPSADFCIKVAQALGESPVLVLVLAGILPPQAPDDDSTLQETVELLRNLPPEQRQQALDYIRFLYQNRR